MNSVLKKYTMASKKNRRTTPLFMMFFLILAMILFESLPSKVSTEQQWAASIILNSEYKGSNHFLHLWTKQPSVSLIENNKNDIEWILKETVMQIDSLLYDTTIKGLHLLESKNIQADILIYHTEFENFSRVAKQHGFSLKSKNASHVWMVWNDKNEIEKAVILLASDHLAGKKLQHLFLKEITKSLGFINESNSYPQSVFYSRPSFTTTLNKLDQHLIRFTYTNLKPGMDASEVRNVLNSKF